jgi:hypothetical protein
VAYRVIMAHSWSHGTTPLTMNSCAPPVRVCCAVSGAWSALYTITGTTFTAASARTLEHFQPVHPRHHHAEHDHARPRGLQQLQRRRPAADRDGVVAAPLEHPGEDGPGVDVVVNDQDHVVWIVATEWATFGMCLTAGR